ncbi:CPXV192 protein [Cowpox virus]|uniref:CPXV192 protein n=1 Tax=Cowpox virus TaxID=10243 RepID=A0A290G578_COWPX|nr:CPXV192 protein [Cowpox virus]ATB55457.1 CPXV192 protein [Cowpox virus]ATB55671.1 CPXV192 protein [Cowpox virus]ATB55886.1 CPXV192 protein [Cowpox virus]ATB56101.1 CPXV192 protein [Cowpox virus]
MNSEILFVNRVVLVNIATTYVIIELVLFLHANYLNVISHYHVTHTSHHIATW